MSGAHFEMSVPRSTDTSGSNEKAQGASACVYLYVLYSLSKAELSLCTTFAKSVYQITAQQKGNFDQDFGYQVL